MASRANADLYKSLDKIIGELEKTADAKVSLTPVAIRHVTATLRIVRNCHVSLSEFEALIGENNVVPIHGHSVRV